MATLTASPLSSCQTRHTLQDCICQQLQHLTSLHHHETEENCLVQRAAAETVGEARRRPAGRAGGCSWRENRVCREGWGRAKGWTLQRPGSEIMQQLTTGWGWGAETEHF